MSLARLKHMLTGACARLDSASGSMLIEVMVGVLVLAIVTAAVLDGLDGAQATGRKNKDRSVAATLAQQDIERLRALPIPALVGLAQSRTVDVSGVRYTVTSQTTWMRDNSGELSCTDDTSQASFLKVVSAVWSPASADRPVTETTLITPPISYSATQGTVTVKLTDREGKPRPGVGVNLSGPASYTGTTNDLGCAIFSFIPAGKYTASIPGDYVTWASSKPVTTEIQVIAGKTTPKQLELEPPASLRISFKLPSGEAVKFAQATVPHANLPGGSRTFTSGAAASSIDAVNLFPQKDGYAVFAGDCETNNPANQYWGDPDYFLNHPASHADVEPGALLVAVEAVIPVLQVRVEHKTNVAVYLLLDAIDKPTSEVDCREHIKARTRVFDSKGGKASSVTDSYEIAVPFGTYRVCVDDGSRRTIVDVPVTKPEVVQTAALSIPSIGTKSTCTAAF